MLHMVDEIENDLQDTQINYNLHDNMHVVYSGFPHAFVV